MKSLTALPGTSTCWRLRSFFLLCSASLSLVVALGGAPGAEAETPRRPNILVLYADDLGYGDLSCYNVESKIPTTHLDRLASDGMRFTDAHASASLCSPSRYALLTGCYHWRRVDNIVGAFGRSIFDPGRLTLPEMLRRQGYATACIGKWHLGWNWDAVKVPGAQPAMIELEGRMREFWSFDAFDWSKPIPDGPTDHGFDYYFGDEVVNFPPYAWIENATCVEPPDANLSITQETKEGEWETRPGPARSDWDFYANLPTLINKGADWLRARRGNKQPFFLYLPLPSPHAPIVPDDAFDGASQAGAYGDYVVQTDAACGQILRALEEAGCADDTLVVFSSDNGPERYAYARDARFGHWSASPLRGAKRDVYEGAHRVPFLVRWPGVVKPGAVCDALASQVDLMATIAEIVGFELPSTAAEDSLSLLPALHGAKGGRTTLVHASMNRKFAIRQDGWTFIDAPHGYENPRDADWEARHGYVGDENAQGQLFDLTADVGQRTNLVERFPQRAAELRALLADILAHDGSRPSFRHQPPASR